MIFVLDNYDSFTYNLVQRLGEIDRSLAIEVARNDELTVADIAQLAPERIIVSPGPCTPHEAGISRQLIAELGPTIPTLGVCLGHQCLGDVYGAQVVRAPRLMHGKTSLIRHDGRGLFAGLENPFVATRYHSLIVPEETLTADLIATAWSADPGETPEIMGLRHRKHPIFGVQFHPESFLCPAGIRLLQNFLKMPSAQDLQRTA
ncbi:MAG: aminodeoxychorismate/anthranilate synthase component II [Planctomycetaceae bacterium]